MTGATTGGAARVAGRAARGSDPGRARVDLDPAARHSRCAAGDRGSVTPLVIAMVVCLLLLGAGVTAGTSVFLARQRLQGACDGAAAAAADAARAGPGPGENTGTGADGGAVDAARRYLAVRHLEIGVSTATSGAEVVVTCTASAAITLGALFGMATMTQTVQAVGRPVL